MEYKIKSAKGTGGKIYYVLSAYKMLSIDETFSTNLGKLWPEIASNEIKTIQFFQISKKKESAGNTSVGATDTFYLRTSSPLPRGQKPEDTLGPTSWGESHSSCRGSTHPLVLETLIWKYLNTEANYHWRLSSTELKLRGQRGRQRDRSLSVAGDEAMLSSRVISHIGKVKFYIWRR